MFDRECSPGTFRRRARCSGRSGWLPALRAILARRPAALGGSPARLASAAVCFDRFFVERSSVRASAGPSRACAGGRTDTSFRRTDSNREFPPSARHFCQLRNCRADGGNSQLERSEEHTSELQSRYQLVCSLLLEKKTNRFSAAAASAIVPAV